jgi:hypothetical protein
MFTSVSSNLLIAIYMSHILSTKARVPSSFLPNGGHAKGDYACNFAAEASF